MAFVSFSRRLCVPSGPTITGRRRFAKYGIAESLADVFKPVGLIPHLSESRRGPLPSSLPLLDLPPRGGKVQTAQTALCRQGGSVELIEHMEHMEHMEHVEHVETRSTWQHAK